MVVQPEPVTPLVYEVVEATTEQTTVIDVVLGAFSVVGVLGLVAVLLGVSLAGLLIGMRSCAAGTSMGPPAEAQPVSVWELEPWRPPVAPDQA